MVDVEPSEDSVEESEVGQAYVRIAYVSGARDLIVVPLVDEYESADQAEESDAFTLEDLNSEIASAFELGDEGVLSLPHVNPDPGCHNGRIYVQLKNVLTLYVYEHDEAPTFVSTEPTAE